MDTSSVPAIAVSRGVPHVVWASADSGRGRISLWTPRGLDVLYDAGGDQLLPAVAANGRGAVVVSFSSADAKSGWVDRLLWRAGRVERISSAPSFPRDDRFFSGRFIGWNSGLAFFRGDPIAVWPDQQLADELPGTELDRGPASHVDYDRSLFDHEHSRPRIVRNGEHRACGALEICRDFGDGGEPFVGELGEEWDLAQAIERDGGHGSFISRRGRPDGLPLRRSVYAVAAA